MRGDNSCDTNENVVRKGFMFWGMMNRMEKVKPNAMMNFHDEALPPEGVFSSFLGGPTTTTTTTTTTSSGPHAAYSQPLCSKRPLPRGSGMILALKDISNSLREYVESGAWKVTLQWFFRDVVVPIFIFLIMAALLAYIGHKIYRWLCPYSAVELHKQGLQALQHTSRRNLPVIPEEPDSKPQHKHESKRDVKNASTQASHITTRKPSKQKSQQASRRKSYALQREKQRAEEQAESLWKQALEQDPDYDSATVSLAAMYVYRQDKPDKALDLIQTRSKRRLSEELSSDLKAIEEDAKAIQQGHRSMVKVDLAENEYLSVLAALSRDSKYRKQE